MIIHPPERTPQKPRRSPRSKVPRNPVFSYRSSWMLPSTPTCRRQKKMKEFHSNQRRVSRPSRIMIQWHRPTSGCTGKMKIPTTSSRSKQSRLKQSRSIKLWNLTPRFTRAATHETRRVGTRRKLLAVLRAKRGGAANMIMKKIS